MVFPEGFTHDKGKGIVLTQKVNPVFQRIADVQGISTDDGNEKGGMFATFSNHVGQTRFELATPTSRT
jgi:hypothetical protein